LSSSFKKLHASRAGATSGERGPGASAAPTCGSVAGRGAQARRGMAGSGAGLRRRGHLGPRASAVGGVRSSVDERGRRVDSPGLAARRPRAGRGGRCRTPPARGRSAPRTHSGPRPTGAAGRHSGSRTRRRRAGRSAGTSGGATHGAGSRELPLLSPRLGAVPHSYQKFAGVWSHRPHDRFEPFRWRRQIILLQGRHIRARPVGARSSTRRGLRPD